MPVPRYRDLYNPVLAALKDLRLGVDVHMIEDVSILSDWFKQI